MKKSPILHRALFSPSYPKARNNGSVGKKLKKDDKTTSLLSELPESKNGKKQSDSLLSDRPSMTSIMRKLTDATKNMRRDSESESDSNSNMSSLDISTSKIDFNKSAGRALHIHASNSSD